MNRDRILNQVRELAPRRPSILGSFPIPNARRIRKLDPLEVISDAPSDDYDVIILDNSLCFEPNPLNRLKEIHRRLKPDGQLIIGDVVRRRRLPSDLENKKSLWTRGFASAILQSDFALLLEEAGFQLIELKAANVSVDQLIAAYDALSSPIESKTVVVSEDDWIASTQACCGIETPRSESLAELLKCDDVGALWTTKLVIAKTAMSSSRC